MPDHKLRPNLATRQILWPLVETHLHAGALQYALWERSLTSPTENLAQVFVREDVLFSHVACMVETGLGGAERALEQAVRRGEPSRVFVAALALLQNLACDAVVDHFKDGEMPAPLSRALALSSRFVEPVLVRLLGSGIDTEITLALETLAFRRTVHPEHVTPFLESRECSTEVSVAALRVARLLGREFAFQIRKALDSPLPRLRAAAMEAGLVIGLKAAFEAARRAVVSREIASSLPLCALACGGDDHDLERIEALLTAKHHRAAALFALGLSGRRRAVEASLPFMHHPALARLAGEVVSFITGLKLENELCLPSESQPTEPISLGEQALEDDLAPSSETELPLPDPNAVERWWSSNNRRFDSDKRYLYGLPFGENAIHDALMVGPMRRRHALMYELAIRTSGSFSIESRTWAHDQRDLRGLSACSLDRFQKLFK